MITTCVFGQRGLATVCLPTALTEEEPVECSSPGLSLLLNLPLPSNGMDVFPNGSDDDGPRSLSPNWRRKLKSVLSVSSKSLRQLTMPLHMSRTRAVSRPCGCEDEP